MTTLLIIALWIFTLAVVGFICYCMGYARAADWHSATEQERAHRNWTPDPF